MSVNQTDEYPYLLTEVRLIQQAIDHQIPVLGICLGAQLIAKALGANVKRNGEKEIGWYPVSPTEEGRHDPVMRHFEDKEHIFQWHEDTFKIPANAVRIACSPLCENQAFRYGENVYAFQFHLEVDEPMIERWLRVPFMKRATCSAIGRSDEDFRHDKLEKILTLGCNSPSSNWEGNKERRVKGEKFKNEVKIHFVLWSMPLWKYWDQI
jgi:GMP synthase (glutamine-hydrolysing)